MTGVQRYGMGIGVLVGLSLSMGVALADGGQVEGEASKPKVTRGKPHHHHRECRPRIGGERLSVYGISFETTLAEAERRLCTKSHAVRGRPGVREIRYQEMRALFYGGELAVLRVDQAIPNVHARELYADLRHRFGPPVREVAQEGDNYSRGLGTEMHRLMFDIHALDAHAVYPYQLCWGSCERVYLGGAIDHHLAEAYDKDAFKESDPDSGHSLLASVKHQSYHLDLKNYAVFKQMRRDHHHHRNVAGVAVK